MYNQKGEVVTGVMLIVMAGMMIFGMFYMHGGHCQCGHDDHIKKSERQHEQSAAGSQQMRHGDTEKNAPASGLETK